MNNNTARLWRRLATGAWLSLIAATASGAERVHFKRPLTEGEVLCLYQSFRDSSWSISSKDKKQILTDAKVGHFRLDGGHRKEYLFLIEGVEWCGTAGCSLLIGEPQRDGTCHLLYNGNGGDDVSILRRRDNGYYRIYAPCELRFDGRRYQQVREACPNLDVPR